MEKQIIDGPMDIDERLELIEYMYNDINNSMENEGRFKSFAQYKLSTFNSFYSELQEIADNEGKIIGRGIETDEYIFILNEKTEDNFICAFQTANRKACKQYENKHAPNPMTWMAPIIGGMGGWKKQNWTEGIATGDAFFLFPTRTEEPK